MLMTASQFFVALLKSCVTMACSFLYSGATSIGVKMRPTLLKLPPWAFYSLALLYGAAFAPAATIYVANVGNNTVSKVVGGVTSPFASGFSTPNGVAIDASGNVFVANQSAGSIIEITPGGDTSTFVSGGLSSPEGLVFRGGILYVANNGGGTISAVTAGGGVSTYATGVPSPQGLAFDGSGVLYSSNFNNAISKIAAGGGAASTFV